MAQFLISNIDTILAVVGAATVAYLLMKWFVRLEGVRR